MSDECISPLRRRMIEEMTVRKFTLKTTAFPRASNSSRLVAVDYGQS
jgi:hypothetical protein